VKDKGERTVKGSRDKRQTYEMETETKGTMKGAMKGKERRNEKEE
jgi:hypothetical protein